MKIPWDTYTLRARLWPPLLAALPVALAIVAAQPGGSVWWGTIWAVVAWCGGTALLAQFGRDLGKRGEPSLFARWGGPPTTAGLRHRDASNKVLVGQRHRRLAELLPDLCFPAPDEEAADPATADAIYEAAAVYLRENTRDRDRFRLVFEENCNYGFRRNLLGMKPVGVAMALLGVGAVVVILSGRLDMEAHVPTAVAACAINLLLLLAWLFWITPNWVKAAADEYADRLLGTTSTL